MPDPEDANWIYAMSQGGNVGRYHVPTGESWFIKPVSPDLKTRLRFNWNAALAQDPFDKSTIYFGSQYLHKSVNKGRSWETISPDLTTNDSVKIDQSNNGGLSVDITGAENYCTILTIAPSPKERGVIWVGTDDGHVQLTRDGGKTWTSFRGKIPGMPVGAWVPQIQASKHSAGEAFVVCNDYRRGDFRPYVFRTTDFGKTWTRMGDEKKLTGYALCVLQDPSEPRLIFVGTEQGLWVSLDNGVSFEQWKNGYPSVSTYDLAIQEREADLAIATFGRTLWILDDIRPLRKLAAENGQFGKPVQVLSTPDAVQASFRNAPGYEWSTWGIWDAANRPRGAAVSYFIRPTAQDSARKGRDSVQVMIYDDKNQPVRKINWKADEGFNRRYWGMEGKGYRMPGSPKPRPGAPEPGGLPVLPGTYKIVLQYMGAKDSGMITIKDDPRLGNRNDVKIAQEQMRTRLRGSSDKLTAALDNLSDAEEGLKKVEAAYKDQQGKGADSVRKVAKAMQDSVTRIREFVSGKRQTRQGYGQVPQVTVLSELMQANRAIGSKPVAPGAQETMLVERAEGLIGEAVQRVDRFMKGPWTDFQKLVRENPVSVFKN
jgi:hypothetical protein